MLEKNEVELLHGSDHAVVSPQYGAGKPDNDYGSGFYLTPIWERAQEWALLYGSKSAVVTKYRLCLDGLTVIDLDDYGPLAWIAEVAANRGVSSMVARSFVDDFIRKYRIDLSLADVVVGYRADDSYGDVIEAFLSGEITVDEVRRLFYKGDLGVQWFLKSQKAFERIQYLESLEAGSLADAGESMRQARRQVLRFLENRRLQIARRYILPEISVLDALEYQYVYRKEGGYYENRSTRG